MFFPCSLLGFDKEKPSAMGTFQRSRRRKELRVLNKIQAYVPISRALRSARKALRGPTQLGVLIPPVQKKQSTARSSQLILKVKFLPLPMSVALRKKIFPLTILILNKELSPVRPVFRWGKTSWLRSSMRSKS